MREFGHMVHRGRVIGLAALLLSLLAPPSVQAEEWGTYRSMQYRFRFQYPREWKVSEELRDQPGFGSITYVFASYHSAGGDEALLQLWISWIRVSPDQMGPLTRDRYSAELEASARSGATIVDARLLPAADQTGFYYTYQVPGSAPGGFAIVNARAQFQTRYVYVDGTGFCRGAPAWVMDCRAVLRRVFESVSFRG